MFRNLLALIGLAFVLFVIVGFTMKWYTFSREEGKLTVHIFTDRVEEGLGKIRDGAVELKDNLGKALTKPSEETKPSDSGLQSIFGPAAAPRTPAGPPAPTPTPAPRDGRTSMVPGIGGGTLLPASGR